MGIKTKVGLALATSAVGAAMLAGGSFALFSASSTNSSNAFTAGTVKIQDNTNGGVWQSASFIGNMAPGDSENGTLTIQNTGSLDEWVKVTNTGTGDLFTGANPVVVSSSDAQVFKLASGASTTLHYTYTMPHDAGNEYQGKTGNEAFTINAVQVRNNDGASGPQSWQ